MSEIPKPAKLHPDGAPLPALLEMVSELILEDFRRDLEEVGYGDIRPGHGCVFGFLEADGMRLTDLAARAGMTKQSVGEAVDDLVKLGYVERVPDPADRRAKLIRLTEKGRTAQATGFGLFDRLEGRWRERHGAKRIALLRETLEDIVTSERPEAAPQLARPRISV